MTYKSYESHELFFLLLLLLLLLLLFFFLLLVCFIFLQDTMQYIRPNVHTIAMGQASSMGSLLLAGGAPGCRSALPNATIMLHQPSGGAQGMASDIQIAAKNILEVRQRLNLIYQTHTNQPLERIEQVMDRDTFMDVPQALEFGVIDQVLDKRQLPLDEQEDEE
jgi:ATP-dependent Clp protease protease subunit